MKKITAVLIWMLLAAALLAGCGKTSSGKLSAETEKHQAAEQEADDSGSAGEIIGGADSPTVIILSSEAAEDGAAPLSSLIGGTWQTASISYEYAGTMQPAYYVRFTDSQISYGHMKDEGFVEDHADAIDRLEVIGDGRYRVQAHSANGTQYTCQTSESDPDVMEFYETWKEEDFPDMYRGGSSLSRCEWVRGPVREY